MMAALVCARCGEPEEDSDHGYGGTHNWRPDTVRDAAERLVAAGPHPTPLNETWGREWDALRAALAASPAPALDVERLARALAGVPFLLRLSTPTNHGDYASGVPSIYEFAKDIAREYARLTAADAGSAEN